MSRERDRQRDRTSRKSSPRNHDYLIKLRGIPYSSNKDDIKKFLYPCRLVTIHLFNTNGSSSGECLIDLESETDVKDALKKSNEFMGKRYIEVFRATNYEYNFFVKHKGMISWREPVIRMSGLPFTCTMADVQLLFKDIEIARNGIYITRDMSDNAVGDGFVAFVNLDNAYKAIDLYNQKRIQHRYIELTPSTYDEAKKKITNDALLNGKRFAGESDDEENKRTNNNNGRSNRSRSKRRSRSTSREHRYRPPKRRRSPSVSPRPRARPPPKIKSNQRSRENYRRRSRSRSPVRRSSPVSNRNGEYLIKMRGMPFTVLEDDIREFFPSSCQPVRIEVLQDRRTNRPNGDAHVYFNSTDGAKEAMKCDRKYMGSRYVELYFDSPRETSTNDRRSKTNESPPPRASRSPSKEKINEEEEEEAEEAEEAEETRSRSIVSFDENISPLIYTIS